MHTVGVVNVFSCVEAYKPVVGLSILGINKVNIVGCYAFNPGFFGKFKDNLIHLLLLKVCVFGKTAGLNWVEHHLEVKIVAKNFFKLIHNFLGFSNIPFHNGLRNFSS